MFSEPETSFKKSLDSLAYLTARTNGFDHLAKEIITAAGLTEAELQDLPAPSSSTLKPPTVVSTSPASNWPTIPVENVFDHAMLNGNGFVLEEEPQAQGADVNAASVALDDWAAEDAVHDEEQGDGAWDLEGEEDAFVDAEGDDAALADEELTPGASRGMSETEFWTRNSPFAADHVAAGSFETAMQVCWDPSNLAVTLNVLQLLNRQVGVVNFKQLKGRFLALYRALHTYLTPNPSMPPLHLYLRRNIAQSAPGQILPASYQTLAIAQAELQEVYTLFNKADLTGAKGVLVQTLLSMLFIIVSNDEEAKQVGVHKWVAESLQC